MINITLPTQTLEACLVALGKFPYSEAQPHIDAIRAAVAAISTPATPTTPATTEEEEQA